MREINIRLTDSDMTRMLRWKESEGFKDRDWIDFFRYKTTAFSLADNVGEIISRNTETMLGMWLMNYAKNLVFLRVAHDQGVLDDLKTLPLQNIHDARDLIPVSTRDLPLDQVAPVGACIVIGRGPSVFKHKHLDILAKAQFKTPPTILSTDGMLLECLRAGVTPDKFPNFYSISVDGHRELILKWYDDPLVDQYGAKLKVIVGSTVSNNVIRRCLQAGANVYMLHPIFDSLGEESLTKIMMMTTQTDATKPLLAVQSLGNAGGLAWVLSWNLLRCSPSILIGLTYGYEPETPIEDTSYASKALELGDLEGATQSLLEVKNPYDGKLYRTDHIFMHYKKSFLDTLDETPPAKFVRTINATEGGILWGHKYIEYMPFADALNEIAK